MDIIKIKDFKKSFGSKEVHRGVTLDVRKGECLGLIGGSGAGKSVILRSIIGLDRPDSGSIVVDGIDITKMPESDMVAIRKRVAYCFQDGALFDSMTVYENLAYPLREHTKLSEEEISKKILDELEEFGLAGNESLFPGSLSGGMQKRVGVARAIIMDPDVVLYDEPTAGLDPYNTRKMQDMINRLKSKGVTSILVTHDMQSAFNVCDRIAILRDGIIDSVGTREELDTSTGGLIQRFINGELTSERK